MTTLQVCDLRIGINRASVETLMGEINIPVGIIAERTGAATTVKF